MYLTPGSKSDKRMDVLPGEVSRDLVWLGSDGWYLICNQNITQNESKSRVKSLFFLNEQSIR